MSDEKVLTKEIVEQFLADEDSVDLSEFTVIEDDAAESLSYYTGDCLWLHGLTSLSDSTTEILSKYEGELYLDGITSLSEAAAQYLSKFKGKYLCLNGLTSLSGSAAEHLANYSGTLQLAIYELTGKDGNWNTGIRKMVRRLGTRLSDYSLGEGLAQGFVGDTKITLGCGNCGRREDISVDVEQGEFVGDFRPSIEESGWSCIRHDKWGQDPLTRCPDCSTSERCQSCGEVSLVTIPGQEPLLCLGCDIEEINKLIFDDEDLLPDNEDDSADNEGILEATQINELIHAAVEELNISEIYSLIKNNEFVLLSTAQDDQEGHEGAFIANIDGMEALMVFSSNEVAKQFVDESSDSISPDKEIDGIIIEGEALLDYVPEHYGILLDPESDSSLVIEPDLLQKTKLFTTEDSNTDEEMSDYNAEVTEAILKNEIYNGKNEVSGNAYVVEAEAYQSDGSIDSYRGWWVEEPGLASYGDTPSEVLEDLLREEEDILGD